MNSKSRVRMLHEENVIEINKVFAKMAENPFSEEYAVLQNLRKDYPVYKVHTREIKKNPNKECFKGLTYDYMEDYIRTHSDTATLDEFNEKRLISACHSKAFRYPVIKKWFLEKFPEVANFGVAPAEETENKDGNSKSEETKPNNVTDINEVKQEENALAKVS